MTSRRFVCPICDFGCGKNEKFKLHLATHGFASIEEAYVELKLDGKTPICACNACKEIPAFHGWNHGFSSYVTGHNGRLYSALPKEEADKIVEKRAASLRGKKGWSRGLTKENCKALARAAKTRSKTMKSLYESGELTAWSKGLTKETDERLAAFSNLLEVKFANGDIVPWAKGLTKETDERVYQMSLSVSKTHRAKELRERLDAIKRLDPHVIKKRLDENVEQLELVSPLEDYTRDRHANLDFVCRVCGRLQTKSLIQALSDRCDFCSPLGSRGQRELSKFAETLDEKCRFNDRTVIEPLEIDVVLPSYHVGIEFNGLYFHSEIFKQKKYHDDKSMNASVSGWKLFHVWEDEWRDKRPIVESMIKHRCGLNPTKVYARNCRVVKLSSCQRRDFFESNHIDGDVRASDAWGLVDPNRNNKLVAAISTRKPMHKKWKGSLEVARFSTLINESIPGALGKLMKPVSEQSLANGNRSIITYADSRFGSTGQSCYNAVGFSLRHHTPPRFWWTDGSNRIDRFKIRADKKNGLSEKEVADSHGVVKVWGCRNLFYELVI